MATFNSHFLKNTILTILYTLNHSYMHEGDGTTVPTGEPITFAIAPKNHERDDNDYDKLNNTEPQFLTQGVTIESKDKGYLVVFIPIIDKKKVFQLNYVSAGSPAPSTTNTPYKINVDLKSSVNVPVKQEIGTAHAYFRKLKSSKGVKEVGESMLLDDIDELEKDLKKYTEDEAMEFNDLKLYIEFSLKKETLARMDGYITAVANDRGTDGTGTGTSRRAAAPITDVDDYPIIAENTLLLSSSPTPADGGDAFSSSRKFHIYLKDKSGTLESDGDIAPGAWDENTMKKPENFYFFLIWEVNGTNVTFVLDSQTETGNDLTMHYINKELNSGTVIELIKKKFRNLIALWVVIGIVGAALLIGVICACIFCK